MVSGRVVAILNNNNTPANKLSGFADPENDGPKRFCLKLHHNIDLLIVVGLFIVYDVKKVPSFIIL